MQVKRLPPEHYAAIPETPVELRPFDPASKQAALRYERDLNRLLGPCGVKAHLFGSTALELLGKGEWEFALFLDEATWYPTLTFLINHFKSIYVLDDEFALFQDRPEGYRTDFKDTGLQDAEIIAMRGDVALWNQTIMHYWQEHPEARAAYEAGKLEHAHSKRAYYLWKDELIAGILGTL